MFDARLQAKRCFVDTEIGRFMTLEAGGVEGECLTDTEIGPPSTSSGEFLQPELFQDDLEDTPLGDSSLHGRVSVVDRPRHSSSKSPKRAKKRARPRDESMSHEDGE
jgi:hypothetical protein